MVVIRTQIPMLLQFHRELLLFLYSLNNNTIRFYCNMKQHQLCI